MRLASARKSRPLLATVNGCSCHASNKRLSAGWEDRAEGTSDLGTSHPLIATYDIPSKLPIGHQERAERICGRDAELMGIRVFHGKPSKGGAEGCLETGFD